MNSDIIWLTIFTDKTRKFVLHSLPKSTLPEFYVLPKVHKHPIKVQPIIPSFNWVTTNLRRSLDCTLCPILLSFPWILRDLKKLLQQLASISVPQTSDVWLLKEDVTSFYSSLPSDEGCQIVQWLASKNGYSEESSHCLSYIMLSGMFLKITSCLLGLLSTDKFLRPQWEPPVPQNMLAYLPLPMSL